MGFFSGESVLTTISGNELEDIVRKLGFSPELGTDSEGDPIVRFMIEGMKVAVVFYGGKDGRYNSLQFAAGFSGKQSLEKINEWNVHKRYGKAFLDKDSEPWIQYDVSLEGGVKREYLEESIRTWRSVFLAFAMHVAK